MITEKGVRLASLRFEGHREAGRVDKTLFSQQPPYNYDGTFGKPTVRGALPYVEPAPSDYVNHPNPAYRRALLKQLCAPRLYSAQRFGNTLWLSVSYRAGHRQIDIPGSTLKRWFTGKDEFGITTDIALEIARLSYAQQCALGLWSSQQRTLDDVSPAKREVYLQLQNLRDEA